MEFRILGPLEVRNGRHAVPLPAAKQRAVLGVLLLEANRTVSVGRLVDELWGEHPPATAEKLVQGYVHALRKQLGDGSLVTQPSGYSLRVHPGTLDLHEFERLVEEARGAELERAVELRRRALSLWRGPPLADVSLEGRSRHTVERLNELRLATEIDRLDAALELGRDHELVGELEALGAEHPYNERLHAQLMLALYRSGRQAEALEAYRAFRQVLRDELGLQPGAKLRELESAMLRQDPALAVEARIRRAAPEEPPAPAMRPARRLAAPAAAAVAIAAAAIGAVALARDDPVAVTAPPNSVALIDPSSNRVVETFPVGRRPGPVALGGGYAWVGNVDDRTLMRIGSETATSPPRFPSRRRPRPSRSARARSGSHTAGAAGSRASIPSSRR